MHDPKHAKYNWIVNLGALVGALALASIPFTVFILGTECKGAKAQVDCSTIRTFWLIFSFPTLAVGGVIGGLLATLFQRYLRRRDRRRQSTR